MSLRKGGQVIAGTPNITTGHHVGEIFWTSRLDNELNGAVEANGATYSVEAFTGEKSVPALLADGKLPSVSMVEYEAIVSASGSCRAWGWDNGDTFRVPTAEKMKRVLVAKKEATTEDPAWYNLYSDGYLEQGNCVQIASSGDIPLPKHYRDKSYTVTVGATYTNSNGEEAFDRLALVGAKNSVYQTTNSVRCVISGAAGTRYVYVCTSGYAEIPTEAEYQFQNIETHRAMVQLATGATDEALMTCTGVLADVTDLKQTTLRTNQITNCITEIPQDIKLELNDGTLTLKAGSKVYMPNGFEEDGTTPKFDVVVIENDVQLLSSLTSTYTDGIYFWCYNKDLNKIQGGNNKRNQIQSNTYDNSAQYCMFYDTTNNIIKYTTDSGATWETGYSLCFCLTELTNGVGNVSIDQIFNGFGYIGSTVFALPGVKGLIPNGRNEDGTCKSTLYTLTSVKTQTFTSASQRGWYLQTNGASSGNSPVYSDTQPSQNYIRWFSQKDNQWYDTHGSPELNSETYILPLALFDTDSTGKITSFTPKQPFQAVDRNDSSWLSGLGMPSNRYIDLTLLASGSNYTAPANGYFSLYVNKGDSTQAVLRLENGNIAHQDARAYGSTGDSPLFSYIPARKGDSIACIHTYTGTFHWFRFVYAEGENS